MGIREDMVTSAVKFLQDPEVATSPLPNRISFLRSKSLTQEEIDAALARAGAPVSGAVAPPSPQAIGPSAQQQQHQYYSPYQQPPYGWQPAPLLPPKRDWRDWFIMATVVGGVSYGAYSFVKRYVYPLIVPPTPEKLDQDKSAMDTQFEQVFASLEQLSKDTELLKASEQRRTEKVDKTMTDVDKMIRDVILQNHRLADETDRLREDMRSLKDSIPRGLEAQKDFSDGRLGEISSEVKSLKALLGQRLASATAAVPSSSTSTQSKSKTTVGAADALPAGAPRTPAAESSTVVADQAPNVDVAVRESEDGGATQGSSRWMQDHVASVGGRSGRLGSGMPSAKATIPAWQRAMVSKVEETAGGSQQATGSSSSSSK